MQLQPEQGRRDSGADPRWAVIKTGGKQYRVRVGDQLNIERSAFRGMTAAANEEGQRHIEFNQLIAVCAADGSLLSKADLDAAYVAAELMAEFRGDKVKVFKKRRCHNYRRTQGHRQHLHRVRILAIQLVNRTTDNIQPIVETKLKPVAASTGPRTAHEDFVSILEALRSEGANQDLLVPLSRVGATDWKGKPSWVRDELLQALEWHLNADAMEVRAAAAIALDRVLRPEPAEKHRSWRAISTAVRDHLIARDKPVLEFSVRRSAEPNAKDQDRFTARVLVRKSIELPQGHEVDLTPLAKKSLAASFQIKGTGIVGSRKADEHAGNRHPRVAAETAISFRNRNPDDPVAVVDVYLDGRRRDRRFLDLTNERVTRVEPLNPVPEAAE